jgi:tetratricopeptide (TPR) repeat protein
MRSFRGDWVVVRRSHAIGLVLAGVLASSCSPAARSAVLLPVALPDLTRLDPAVQAQVRERYEAVTQQVANRATSPADLALAYGRYGMLLQAARYFDAAEPSYLNAQALAREDVRWPYYLAHVYKSRGQTDRAESAFRQVLALRPDHVPGLVWLGRLLLDEGRPAEAEPLFEQALAASPRSVAALAGRGRADLARRDFAGAARHFEQALSIDPGAESLHSPLAMAYRGLGDLDKAAPHLRQWKNTDVPLPDPLQQDLDLLLESGLSYELRGVHALEAKDFNGAVVFFRKGLELTAENTPLRRSLQHKLGTALFMTGQLAAAADQFESVAREAPAESVDESTAKAHYSLGVLAASNGRLGIAREHFEAAVHYQPAYLEARLALGDVQRRSGQAEASLHEYEEALRINPRAAQARLGYAMSLVRLRRFAEAGKWLDESVRLQPDEPTLSHALARLLVSAPDDRVRDGRRGMAIVQELLKGGKRTDLGETLAMAEAELGNFDEAAAIQRGVLAAAQRTGLEQAVRRMEENLDLYARRQPCRMPWKDDDLVVLPAVTAK